jgi:hypothetical protein
MYVRSLPFRFHLIIRRIKEKEEREEEAGEED